MFQDIAGSIYVVVVFIVIIGIWRMAGRDENRHKPYRSPEQ
jgi:hypothetical protein